MRHQILTEPDFLDTVEVNLRAEKISIGLLRESIHDTENAFPEIFDISLTDADLEINHMDVTDIENVEKRTTLRNLIENYKSNRVCETNIKMKILLKDEESVG